jgi:alpha-L-rhamnosidase
VRIKPFAPTGLDFVSARITTPRGEISSSWYRVRDGIRLEVQVPDDTPTEVCVPISAAGVHVAEGQANLLRDEQGYRIYELDAAEHRQLVLEP